MIFKKISSIDLKNPYSWQDKIFLTFDLDWCSDEVLDYTLKIIEKHDIETTFFITHKTPLLSRMRENPKIELGIHPNFNSLLNGEFQYGMNHKEVIEHFLRIVPEAVSVRSHSMTQNTPILQTFEDLGLKYDCNTFIPYSSDIILKPFKHWTANLVKVPYFWEDDVHCLYKWEWEVEKFLNYKGLKVFDFHPIHVFLNTEKMERYEESRGLFNEHEGLKRKIN